ncbi:MAG: hypothetical protein MjAS7_0156 [Metallosphaera javensis (ex Sakai et al. 2022)]|nr:MAG: hypothetical protein MjAS7_0156 [Metallosphaera javensis (ex Sakai et al. 2022)]
MRWDASQGNTYFGLSSHGAVAWYGHFGIEPKSGLGTLESPHGALRILSRNPYRELRVLVKQNPHREGGAIHVGF